ncbi:Uncharacterized protein HZ326_31173, partial [Fusarium oxysporum f. sp. albedinis]
MKAQDPYSPHQLLCGGQPSHCSSHIGSYIELGQDKKKETEKNNRSNKIFLSSRLTARSGPKTIQEDSEQPQEAYEVAVGIGLERNVALVHTLRGQEKQRKDVGGRSAIFGVTHS